MKKKLFLDLETSGNDPSRHGIIQLAGLIEIDNKVVEEFDLKTRLLKGDKLSLKAIEVNGFTMEDIKGFPDPNETREAFLSRLIRYVDPFDPQDKFFMFGYNTFFDYRFITTWLKRLGYSFFGGFVAFPVIDVMAEVALHFGSEVLTWENMKLPTVAAHMNIDLKGVTFHDALDDIKITRAIYQRLK